MKTVSRFTDIGDFRNVISHVVHAATYVRTEDDGTVIRNETAKRPSIKFTGTVKLHGTNASVRCDADGDILYQSRENIVSVIKDNAGFAFFGESKKHIFTEWNTSIRERNRGLENSSIIFYGEWCGGKIQKGMAISGLPKMFVLFAIKIVPEDITKSYYLHEDLIKQFRDNVNSIYNIYDFKTYELEIDFNNPKLSQNDIVDLVNEVENECPVGKAFGRVLGEDCTMGEGIVWVGWDNGRRYVFKTKGLKHSTSKVKTLASVDVEKLNSINEFVAYAVTENRLNQGIEQVFTSKSMELDKKHTGDYIRWIIGDVLKEELDTLIENNLEPKDVQKAVMFVARNWFFTYMDEIAFKGAGDE